MDSGIEASSRIDLPEDQIHLGDVSPTNVRWVMWWQWWSMLPCVVNQPTFDQLIQASVKSAALTAPDCKNYPSWLLSICLDTQQRSTLVELLSVLSNDPSVTSWTLSDWRALLASSDQTTIRAILSFKSRWKDELALVQREILKGVAVYHFFIQQIGQEYPALAGRLMLEDLSGASVPVNPVGNFVVSPRFEPMMDELAAILGIAGFDIGVSESDIDRLMDSFEADLGQSDVLGTESPQ